MLFCPSCRCRQILSRYLRISAKPLFLAISSLMGIFMSICEQTLTSMRPSSSMILVAVSTISPRTLPLTSSRLMSLTERLQCSCPRRKVKRTYSKSREDIMSTFLQERQTSLASPPTTSYCFEKLSMLPSNFFCSSKSLEIDSQLSTSVGKVKKQTNVFSLSSWQQCSRSGQLVSGVALAAVAGGSKIPPSLPSLPLNMPQQGCSSPITSEQSLLGTPSAPSRFQPSCPLGPSSAFLPLASASMTELLSPRQSDIFSWRDSCCGGLALLWPSSSGCSWADMNLLFSSLTSAYWMVSFLMRQKQRQRMALSHNPSIQS